jgi:hypothetical protein
VENPYIHYILHLFNQSISTHFIHLFESIKRRFYKRTSVCGGGRAATAAEEEAGVDGGGGDRQSRERRRLREQ